MVGAKRKLRPREIKVCALGETFKDLHTEYLTPSSPYSKPFKLSPISLNLVPDLTVITPVFCGDSKTADFFVANRGHHSDIGGLVPGSMPPHSTSLDQVS